jgi:23S rRNA (cytidine1920-2'-O)/16S rRNA (cytidine1409-2'-O)-methyltransferase
MRKQRLDTLLAERGLFSSRSRAAASVMAGEVCVGPERRRAQKPGELVAVDAAVSVAERARFVSRGGIKLENALAGTRVGVAGRRVLDVGASTGGFTDCLLQRGAAEVLAVDVGYGELAYSLRIDPRVRVLERTNARHLTPELVRGALAEAGPGEAGADGGRGSMSTSMLPNLAVIDVSFISLGKVLPAVLGCLRESCEVLALVKPQFEVGRARVGHGGVVRDPADRRAALVAVGLTANELGASVRGYCSSGLPGPKGNRETFAWLVREPHARSLEGGHARVPGPASPASTSPPSTSAASTSPILTSPASSRAPVVQGADEIERMAREVEP